MKPAPRHDLAAERAVLGGLLVEPTLLFTVGSLLTPEDFYSRQHGALFALLRQMADERVPIDLVTVSERMLRTRSAERYGGAGYVAELPEAVVSTANLPHYARAVADWSVRRRALEAVRRIEQALVGEEVDDVSDLDATTVVQRGAAALAACGSTRSENSWTTGTAWSQMLDELDRGRTAPEDAAPEGVLPTGYASQAQDGDLDALLNGGFRPGDLVVVGGMPSMGKSAFALGCGANAAQDGARALYFSVEPRLAEWTRRLAAFYTGIPLDLLLDPRRLRQDQFDVLAEWEATARERLSFPLHYQPGADVRVVVQRARQEAMGGGLDLLVVDHLQLMEHPRERGELKSSAIGRTTHALKNLAGELKCVVVLLSQLTREAVRVDGKAKPRRSSNVDWWNATHIPRPSDLRESGDIEQDADIILFPMNYAKARAEGLVVTAAPVREDAGLVHVAKQRNGKPVGTVHVRWDGPCACYRAVEGTWRA